MSVATQYASAPCKLTISLYLFTRWHQFRHVGYLRHQQRVDLWPFDLESGVRVACDVGYLCANFSLPRPLCSQVRPDVRDRRQTKASLNASALWGRGHNNVKYAEIDYTSTNHAYSQKKQDLLLQAIHLHGEIPGLLHHIFQHSSRVFYDQGLPRIFQDRKF